MAMSNATRQKDSKGKQKSRRKTNLELNLRAVQAVQLDKEKLQTWLLNVCRYEFADEIENEDLICYFCIWHAEFLYKYVREFEALVWWQPDPDSLEDVSKELRRKYFEGKAEQCWVQLEKIELPISETDEHEEHEAKSDGQESKIKCFYCGKVVATKCEKTLSDSSRY